MAGFCFAGGIAVRAQTVIAYRGSDDKILDPLFGYGTGAGYATGATATQSELAARFFKAFVNSGVTASNIQLTGHSLGGSVQFL
jgi:hypothetical protein